MALQARTENRGEQSLLEFEQPQALRPSPDGVVDNDYRAGSSDHSARARTKGRQRLPGEQTHVIAAREQTIEHGLIGTWKAGLAQLLEFAGPVDNDLFSNEALGKSE
jgi:hypothetical protein